MKCSEAFKMTNGCNATFTEVLAVTDSSADTPVTSDARSMGIG
jgi:hypothetical protein